MDQLLVVGPIVAMGTFHWLRPDITTPVINSIHQQAQQFPWSQWTATILHYTAEGMDLLKGLPATIKLYIYCLESLPWRQYCDQAAALVQSVEASAALFEETLSKVGHPWIGRGLGLAVLITPVLFPFIVVIVVFYLINLLWLITARIMGTVWHLLRIVSYPVRYTSAQVYRLFRGHNRAPLAPVPVMAAAPDTDQRRGDYLGEPDTSDE